MQLGMIGLGRMGANIVRRLMRDGHECVVYDVNAATVADLVRAVADGELDAALVWGPIAGYQAKAKNLPIEFRALPSEPWRANPSRAAQNEAPNRSGLTSERHAFRRE